MRKNVIKSKIIIHYGEYLDFCMREWLLTAEFPIHYFGTGRCLCDCPHTSIHIWKILYEISLVRSNFL